jgi:hypothetical protein
MRISKMVLSFVLMASVTTLTAPTMAGSSCNMRCGDSRDKNTNPPVKKEVSKAPSKQKYESSKPNRGTRK